MYIMNFLTFVSEVGFPIAGALAAGAFVFIILNILRKLTRSVRAGVGASALPKAMDLSSTRAPQPPEPPDPRPFGTIFSRLGQF